MAEGQVKRLTTEELRVIMDRIHNIRNISVIGHIFHGKSTLADSLVAASGIIAQEVAGDDSKTNSSADEAGHGMSTRSTAFSVCYEMTDECLKNFGGERQGNEYLINLIDSPGHVDFSSEVVAALRITDGAVVVIDCVEGVCLQTRNVLQQALRQGVRPVLIFNKMDRFILEHPVDGESAYQRFQVAINGANSILFAAKHPLGDLQFNPSEGTTLLGWMVGLLP